MRKVTAGAVLEYPSFLVFPEYRLPRAVRIGIHRTVAKQAVKSLSLHPFMTGKVSAVSVFKKSLTMIRSALFPITHPSHPFLSYFHIDGCFFSIAYLLCFFTQEAHLLQNLFFRAAHLHLSHAQIRRHETLSLALKIAQSYELLLLRCQCLEQLLDGHTI